MGLDTEEESGAGARLLGVSLGALSTTAHLALLPGEAVPASAADPAGPADARGDLPLIPGRRGGEWVPGADVEHTELGRGWVMRRVAAVDSLSRLAEVAVRFEVAGSLTARQLRFTVGDAHLTAAVPAPVQPVAGAEGGPALAAP